MKKVTWILAFAVVMCILSSCGQTKNSENTQTNVISRTTEINDDSSEVEETQSDDASASANTNPINGHKEDEQSVINEVPETQNDNIEEEQSTTDEAKLVLCQDLVQVKMRNFSDFNPPEAQPQCVFFYTIVRIHLVTYSYNGYEFVSYCRKLPDIRKSSSMPACNREF